MVLKDLAVGVQQFRVQPDPATRLVEKKQDPSVHYAPLTTEGCVVRLADTISYVGRDVEDAIRLGLIRRSDLPDECVRLLGDTNGKIVYTLVTDLIATSRNSDYVAFSPDVAAALIRLKNFNRAHIYYNPRIKTESAKIQTLFERYNWNVKLVYPCWYAYGYFIDAVKDIQSHT